MRFSVAQFVGVPYLYRLTQLSNFDAFEIFNRFALEIEIKLRFFENIRPLCAAVGRLSRWFRLRIGFANDAQLPWCEIQAAFWAIEWRQEVPTKKNYRTRDQGRERVNEHLKRNRQSVVCCTQIWPSRVKPTP